MSSILEALRELEGERPPTARREIPPPEKPPGATRRAAGAFIPVIGGLAVGMVVFGLYAWGPHLVAEPPAPGTTASPVAEPAGTPERPPWLDRADAPRARVDPGPAPAAAPTRAAGATAGTADDEPRDDPRPSSSGGQVAVEAIKYSDEVGARVATIRFKGRRVTLRQRESIDGIEVQLIMPNGVYVQRGAETYLLPLSR